jgi:hypothetical protein
MELSNLKLKKVLVQWPLSANSPNGTKRMFADGKFFTASGKAQFIAITPDKFRGQYQVK